MRKAEKRGSCIQKPNSKTNKCIWRIEHFKAAQLSTRAKLHPLTSGSESSNTHLNTIGWCIKPNNSSSEGPKESSPSQSMNDYVSHPLPQSWSPIMWLNVYDFYPQIACFVPINSMYTRTQSLQDPWKPLWQGFPRESRGIKTSLCFCFHQTLAPSAAGTPPTLWGGPASYANSTRPLIRSWKSIACFQLDTHGPFSALRQAAFPCGSLKARGPCHRLPVEWRNSPSLRFVY